LGGHGRVRGVVLLRTAGALRAVQMSGAVLWIVYGFLIDATPVVAANALVFAAAAWTFARPHVITATAAPSD
jgi:hypothetical protein